jgi:ribosomal protein S3
MKTVNARTQTLTYSLGKIDNQTISSFLDYGFSKATTSFGSCNIKVIICYRKTKQRF